MLKPQTKSLYSDHSFEALFKANFNALVAFAVSLGTEQEDAEDIVQKVFVKFWDQKDRFDWSKDPKPYLFQSVKNTTYNHFRDIRKQWSTDEFEQELGEEPEIFDKFDLSDLENRINQLIDDLPPRCRMVFVLSRKEDLTNKQIAELLDISVKTVENQITKALNTLRKRMR